MELKELFQETRRRMDKARSVLKDEFARLRTGRASAGLLEGIKVDYYGTSTPVNQLATINIPEPRLIVIQPWDISQIGAIEKAILSSDLGITPTNDGKVIRISIPQLTEERRKELVKVARKYAEECRVAIRNVRRDANEKLKKLEKDKLISQDELKKAQQEIQKITDEEIEGINNLLEAKEREIMEV